MLGASPGDALEGLEGAFPIVPALSWLAVGAVFFLSLAHVSRSRRGAVAAGREPLVGHAELSPTDSFMAGLVPIACLLSFLACWLLVPTLILAWLAGSMAALALLLGRLIRRGFTSRHFVGSLCGQTLFYLALLGLVFATFHSDVHLARAPLLFFAVGALICELLSLRSWVKSIARAEPQTERSSIDRRPRTDSFTPLVGSWVRLILAALVTIYLVPLGLQGPADRARLVRFVEDFDVSSSSPNWADWSLVAVHLARDGGPPPNLGRVAQGLHARLDGGRRVDPYTLRWAARADLLRPADWEASHKSAALERLVRGSGSIPFLEQQLVPILAGARAGALDVETRAHIVERLAASIPSEPAHDGVGEALAVVETLEALGEGQAVAALRGPIHAQLSASWSGATRTRVATGFSGTFPDERISSASFFYTNPTFEALELAARVGLPADVDPRGVRRFLEHAAVSPHAVFPRRDHELVAAAALRRFEGLGLASGYDAAERLARLRALMPGAILALFCVLVSALAPGRTRLGA